jgi:predicted TIM-barrel fold metal-dependent hydrolase
MKIDMHCHLAGDGTRSIEVADHDLFFLYEDNSHLFNDLLAYPYLRAYVNKLRGKGSKEIIPTYAFVELLYQQLVNSKEIDGVMILALDAVYYNHYHLEQAKKEMKNRGKNQTEINRELEKIKEKLGTINVVKTDIWASNNFTRSVVKKLNKRLADNGHKSKKFFFGASVHPCKNGWKDEIDKLLEDDEKPHLIKWVPSTQHIDMDSNEVQEFYKVIAEKKIPLLCHAGVGISEMSYPEGFRHPKLDHFLNLKYPLDKGVTVIAAHCAAPVSPGIFGDPEYKGFFKLMKDFNTGGNIQLYADTSALSLPTRANLLDKILDNIDPDAMLHGTDFPVPIEFSAGHFAAMPNSRDFNELKQTENPFDLDVKIKRAFKFPDKILNNAEVLFKKMGSM